MNTATLDTRISERAAEASTLLEVSYLRVSTQEQAERGGNEEGFSIPAQREANTRKANELGAWVVGEYMDASRVEFCIVHNPGRLTRNRADDV